MNLAVEIWKWISCSNDVMYLIDCVIQRDVYPQKMHSCSKNIRGISFFVLKISVVYDLIFFQITMERSQSLICLGFLLSTLAQTSSQVR